MTSRRQFLQTGSTALLAGMLPVTRSLWTPGGVAPIADTLGAVTDPAIFALLTKAVEAAKSAGAVYADVRYLVTVVEDWRASDNPSYQAPQTDTMSGVGVNALYNGYWGYSSISLGALTPDTAAQAGRGAAEQAKLAAGRGRPRTAELAAAPAAKGTWTTPVEIDPFTVSFAEKNDVLQGIGRYFGDPTIELKTEAMVRFTKIRQYFVSTEGAEFSQTLVRTSIRYHVGGGFDGITTENIASTAGAGWEYILKAPYYDNKDQILKKFWDRDAARKTGVWTPVDIGRFDVVFDGATVAKLADFQLGAATELDRAMGYLANTDGTSYINDPLEMLGNRVMGSPLLNVSANRSMPGGAGTVKWDDEGVEPDEFQLIKDGVLTDFQTTRESASWLAPYYQKIGKPVRSHGGATAFSTKQPATQGPHNLVIAPAKEDTSFEALCSGITKGYAVIAANSRVDQQMLNAETQAGSGQMIYEIVNGKLGKVIGHGMFWSRAPEFWKNLVGLGGAKTVCALGLAPTISRQQFGEDGAGIDRRGVRGGFHTVSAPAARFKQVAATTIQVRSL